MGNKYDLDWFKKRAFESLKSISPRVWDFSDSLLIYSPQAEQSYENIQTEGDPYYDLVTAPETKYLFEIAEKMASELPDNFYYIDLGPGTEHKERFLFDALKRQNKKFIYFPVDINSHFLKLAEEFAVKNNVKVVPVMSSFEECEKFLPRDDVYRFVSIGATFANYHIQDIFSLLSNIIGSNGSAFIDAHIRERVDIEKVREIYTPQAKLFGMPKLNLLGLNIEDIEDINVNNKVEHWFTIKKPSQLMAEKGVKSGDKILVLHSLRYSIEELKNEIKKVFPNYIDFDTKESFVGFLLKK